MAPETINLLINAGAGLLGALIGAGATLVGQWRQRVGAQQGEIKREGREAVRKEVEAREGRQRKAAEDCDALIFRISILARDLSQPNERALDYHRQVAPLLAEVSSHSVFLPSELRERVDEAANVLRVANTLAPDSHAPELFHYRVLWSIAETTQRDVHQAIAAWLQDQPLPPRGRDMQENVAAYRDYVAFLDDWFVEEDEGYDPRRSFFRAHPELLPPDERLSEEGPGE